MLCDEGKIVACKAANQGVKVGWAQWATMPHCFAMILIWTPMSKRYFEEWAGFASRVVSKEGVETRGHFFEAKTLKRLDVDVKALAPLSDEEVKKRMEECREARHLGLEGEAKIMPRL